MRNRLLRWPGLALLTSLVLAAPSPAQPRVWVVAPQAGQGVDFTAIQPAIDAASDGDVVLVRAGSYAVFQITAKSLVLHGDGAVPVALTAAGASGVTIQAIAAHQSVVVRNFALSASVVTALGVASCAGPVTLEDCSFGVPFPVSSGDAVGIAGAARVSLIRCRVNGGTARFPTGGLHAFASNVFAHDCVIAGGSGSSSARFRGAHGALLSNGSTLSASGSTLRGGAGAAGVDLGGFCVPPTDGGDAITLEDAASRAFVLDCNLRPGLAGWAPPVCTPARNGQPIGGAGTATFLRGTTGRLIATSPARAGQNATFGVTGPAGHDAWLVVAGRQDPTLVLGCGGVIHPELATAIVVPLGTIPASGSLGFQLAVPARLLVQGAPLHWQLALTDATFGCVVGTPTAMLVLDAGF